MYPECEYGAGVCRKEKRIETGKYYFACPVKENHGSCSFQVWEDELLDNNKSIVPIQQSSQSDLHVFWEGYQNDETDYDLGKGGDFLVQHSKRMRMMDNSENPLCREFQREKMHTKGSPFTMCWFSRI